MPLPDFSLLTRSANGDRSAQRVLFELLYTPLYRVSLRYINQKEDAEDCLMKGMMKAFQNLHKAQFENEQLAFGWFKKILVNECLMFLRQKNQILLFTEDEPGLDVGLPADILLKTDAEELYNLIRQLPPGYRTVFNLIVLEGYSHKEAAALLKISENTSKTQLNKAKNKLKKLLEQQKDYSYATNG